MSPACCVARRLLAGGMRRWIRNLLLLAGGMGLALISMKARARTGEPAEFPMEFREGLIWVSVAVPERPDGLWFLLDSGASASVVDVRTARRLHLPLGERVRVAGVASSKSGYWPVRLSARLGDLALPADYLALDLRRLSEACDRPVDGLLGADFFRSRVVEVDYARQRLRVRDSSPEVVGATTSNCVPLECGPQGFRVGVQVNGGETRCVRVDTGCATALHWVRPREATPARAEPTRAVGLSGVTVRQTLTGVRLGSESFDTVPTGLHETPIFPGEWGLLGNGLLAQFGTVTFDATGGRLHLGPVGGR